MVDFHMLVMIKWLTIYIMYLFVVKYFISLKLKIYN